MNVPYCSHCKTIKNLMPKPYARPEGRTYFMCRGCNTEKLKRYRHTEKGLNNTEKAVKKYIVNNPASRKAWLKAQVVPLKPCEVCGISKSVHRHHDDYSKPLDVIFLCSLHHKQRHANMHSHETTAL